MTIDIRTSALVETFSRIMAGEGSPFSRISAIVRCGGVEHTPLQILREDTGCDFRNGYMDDHSIVLTFGMGTFSMDIEPFQDDITIILQSQPLSEVAGTLPNSPVVTRRFRAYIADQVTSAVEATNNPVLQNKNAADLVRVVHVRFALEEPAVEQLRKMSIGTVAHSTPPYAVLQTLMTRAFQSLKLDDAEKILGMEFVRANNQEVRRHVVIPDGTALLDVPDLLQNEQGGIYSTALGFYIRHRYIHFWPLYDLARQTTAKRLLQIFVSPSRQGVMVDKTWIEQGRALMVISAGGVEVLDDSFGQLNNEGNAVRFTDARKLMTDFATVSGNKMSFDRSSNNSEFAAVAVGDGTNLARRAPSATANIFLESSKLSKRAGVIVTALWRRSDPDRLVPGMAVEVHYEYRGEIRIIEGTLIGAYSSRVVAGKGLMVDRYVTNTSLNLFVDRNDPDFAKYLESTTGRE